jgi:hypothetical protein
VTPPVVTPPVVTPPVVTPPVVIPPVTPGVGLRKLNYPIRVAYVDTMTSWWGKGIL